MATGDQDGAARELQAMKEATEQAQAGGRVVERTVSSMGEVRRAVLASADEVRRLAGRSGRSAAEIGGLLEGIRSGTAAAARSMEQVTLQVAGGAELTHEAGRVATEMEGVAAVSGETAAAGKRWPPAWNG